MSLLGKLTVKQDFVTHLWFMLKMDCILQIHDELTKDRFRIQYWADHRFETV